MFAPRKGYEITCSGPYDCLNFLVKSPFEPLGQADLKFLTWKTTFLLAKCSAKRVSELQSLSVSGNCLRWKAENAGVLLWPNPSFLPKVLRRDTINQVIELNAVCPDPHASGAGSVHTLMSC